MEESWKAIADGVGNCCLVVGSNTLLSRRRWGFFHTGLVLFFFFREVNHECRARREVGMLSRVR